MYSLFSFENATSSVLLAGDDNNQNHRHGRYFALSKRELHDRCGKNRKLIFDLDVGSCVPLHWGAFKQEIGSAVISLPSNETYMSSLFL